MIEEKGRERRKGFEGSTRVGWAFQTMQQGTRLDSEGR